MSASLEVPARLEMFGGWPLAPAQIVWFFIHLADKYELHSWFLEIARAKMATVTVNSFSNGKDMNLIFHVCKIM